MCGFAAIVRRSSIGMGASSALGQFHCDGYLAMSRILRLEMMFDIGMTTWRSEH